MKKKLMIIIMALVLAIIPVTTGCGSTSGSGSSQSEDSTKANITVGCIGGGIGQEWLEKAAAQFMELHKNDTQYQEGRTGVNIIVDSSKNWGGDAIGNMTSLPRDIMFTEGVNYYQLRNKGMLLRLDEEGNDIINADLGNEVGSDSSEKGKTIKSKIDTNVYSFINTNTGIYGIPYYDTFYGFVYDVTLWEQYGFWMFKNGGFGRKTDGEELSYGRDGVAGTSDDGLPATYADFNKLVKYINSNDVTPILCQNDAGTDYVANILYSYWADYEGEEQFKLNLNFNGTATDLIDVDANGNVTKLQATTITRDNGNLLQKQAGKYYVLKFCQDNLTNSQYFEENTYILCQKKFVNNAKDGDKYAMLDEGSWWENEAKSNFTALGTQYTRHDYALMPIPAADESKVGTTQTSLALSASYGMISSTVKNKQLALDFMKFLHTDAQLEQFTTTTNMTRALSYEISEESLNTVTTYCKSLLNVKSSTTLVYPYSDVDFVINNATDFDAFNWAWKVGQGVHNPWLKMRDGSYTAITYFNALNTYSSSRWSSYIN